jgi:predicted transcriptional regulator
MDESQIIDELDQLKALADPLRQRLLTAFCCQPATTKQVAERLGEKPTRLYHHVDLLEKAGLIELVETRPNRGTLEKYYLTSARQFVVDHQLLRTAAGEDEAALEGQRLLINMLQTTLNEARHRFDPAAVAQKEQGQPVMLAQTELRLSPSQARVLMDRFCDWLESCCEAESEEADEPTYKLTLAMFPVRRGESGDATAEA